MSPATIGSTSPSGRHRARRAREPRVVGAVLAGSLAGMLLVLGLVVSTIASEASVLAFAGAVGVVAGPIAAWRVSRAAVDRTPKDWPTEAIASLLAVGFAVAGAWIVLNSGAISWPPDPLGALAFLTYVVAMAALVIAIFVFAVGVPLGVIWTWALRRILDQETAHRPRVRRTE